MHLGVNIFEQNNMPFQVFGSFFRTSFKMLGCKPLENLLRSLLLMIFSDFCAMYFFFFYLNRNLTCLSAVFEFIISPIVKIFYVEVVLQCNTKV